MRIVFVGQQPNTYEDEGQPLIIKPNSSGERLAKWMGVDSAAFTTHFARVNLNPWHDGDEFSGGYHVAAAKNLYELLYGRRVVLLGTAVAEAFGVTRRDYAYFRFQDHPEAHFIYAVMPHPSGMNRLYNDPQILAQAKNFLQFLWQMRDETQELMNQTQG